MRRTVCLSHSGYCAASLARTLPRQNTKAATGTSPAPAHHTGTASADWTWTAPSTLYPLFLAWAGGRGATFPAPGRAAAGATQPLLRRAIFSGVMFRPFGCSASAKAGMMSPGWSP